MAEKVREIRSDGDAEEAAAAMNGLRAVIEKASQTMRDLTHAGEEWAKGAEERALEMGKELRSHGERAVGGVSKQVEQNPLTSLAVAFALGFIAAALIRR